MAQMTENGVLIADVETKNIMTKSSLPVGGYSETVSKVCQKCW